MPVFLEYISGSVFKQLLRDTENDDSRKTMDDPYISNVLFPDCVGCREGEICTKAGTCECGPTTVRYNGSCVTCELGESFVVIYPSVLYFP